MLRFAVVWLSFVGSQLLAAEYYVSPVGNNADPGTLDAPFGTISYASSRVAPGDVVVIRAGVYRETITPTVSGTADSPITFRAYPGEAVVLSALDPIVPAEGATWQQHSGSIHKIQLTAANGLASPSTGQNVVYCDGRLVGEARWPNAVDPLDFRREHMAAADSGSVDLASGPDAQGRYTGTFNDSDLAVFTPNAWVGGMMRYLRAKGWWQASDRVIESTSASLTFSYAYDRDAFAWDIPGPGDPYFLFGRLVALDTENEVFFDDTGRDGPAYTLYLWKAGGGTPASSSIEIKKRRLCINVGAREWLRFENIRLHGGGISTSAGTRYCTFERVVVENGTINWSAPSVVAVNLLGEHNSMIDCEVVGTTGTGVYVVGASHVVEDCVVRDCGVQCISASRAVSGATVRHNTAFNSGDHTIGVSGSAGTITYNHAYNTGLFTTDVGVINAFNSGDSHGTEVAWNWVHDNRAVLDWSRSWNGGVGIRFDAGGAVEGCSNFSIHHNVIWNTPVPGSIALWALLPSQLNYGDVQALVYNNTCDAAIDLSTAEGSAAGLDVRNNIATMFDFNGVSPSGVKLTNNLFTETPVVGNFSGSAGFISPVNRNVELRADSAAVDAGAVIAPFTDGYRGGAPDIGALESGERHFVAGARIRVMDLAALKVAMDPAIEGRPRFVVSGSPAGRVMPATARLKVGSAKYSANFSLRYDSETHASEAVFDAIDLGAMTGMQVVQLALDGVNYVSLQAVDVSPRVLSSDRFVGPASYLTPIQLSELQRGELTDFAVPIYIDTASLIATGRLRSDGGDINILSADGTVRLESWVESGLGTSRTLVWIRWPEGAARTEVRFEDETCLWLAHGSPGQTHANVAGAVVPEFALDSFQLWLNTNTLDGLVDGTPLAEWPDSSGRGHHASQAATGLRPTYRSGVFNGRSAVRFDGLTTAGTGDFLSVGDGLGQAACDFYCVYAAESPGSVKYQRLISAAMSPTIDYLGGAAMTVDVDSEGLPSPRTSPDINEVRYATARDLRSLVVGRRNNTATEWFRGDLAEVLGFSADLTGLQRNRILMYLRRKYGLVAGASGTADLAASLTVGTTPAIPAIVTQPSSATVTSGSGAYFSVEVLDRDVSYQWMKDGATIAGAVSSSLFIPRAALADAGVYWVRILGATGATTSKKAVLSVQGSGHARLVNLSTRAWVGQGDEVLIPGFVLTGGGQKSLLIRAAGPALTVFGVGGVLPDPNLTVRTGQVVVAGNDDWTLAPDRAALEAARVKQGAFNFAGSTKDAALLISLPASGTACTATVSGTDGSMGVSLVEIYDLDPAATAGRLVNISARAHVGTGSDVLIPGFVISGDVALTLLIRAVGPGLQRFGVEQCLEDPVMTLYHQLDDASSEVIARNDDWENAPLPDEIAAATAAVGGFTLDEGSADAALLVSLMPGVYTVEVAGKNQTTGVALVELYLASP